MGEEKEHIAGFEKKSRFLNKSWDELKTAVKNKATRFSAGSYSKSNTVTLWNFYNNIPAELPKVYGSVFEFVSNVTKEWLLEVQKAPYLCRDGTFDDCGLCRGFFRLH